MSDVGVVKGHIAGIFKMRAHSGLVFLDGNPAYEQATLNEIEKRRGYQYVRCGRELGYIEQKILDENKVIENDS